MSLFSFTQLAAPGTVFAAGLFDASVGEVFPFTDGSSTVEATLVKAVVAPDGRSAELTVDVPGLSFRAGPVSLGGEGS